ncbi:MAG: hypothetical protein GXP62_10495 [Oligoflexia bacterium]|nr:hypothetical protein [Oligoflexia bacterium]
MALLEPFGAHPATGPIHDPLYALIQDGEAAGEDVESQDALRVALARYAEHPAAAAVRAALGPSMALPVRSLSDVLSSHGPWTQDDPVDEVDLRLRQAAEQRKMFEDRLARTSDENARLARTADALALVGAVMAVGALVGWLGALGLWSIDWISPPTPPTGRTFQEHKP